MILIVLHVLMAHSLTLEHQLVALRARCAENHSVGECGIPHELVAAAHDEAGAVGAILAGKAGFRPHHHSGSEQLSRIQDADPARVPLHGFHHVLGTAGA